MGLVIDMSEKIVSFCIAALSSFDPQALRLEVDDFAVTRDQRDDPRDFVAVEITLDVVVDAREPGRRHADALGLAVGTSSWRWAPRPREPGRRNGSDEQGDPDARCCR